MNYLEHFREKDDRALQDLMSNRLLLNFEAQRCLRSEIDRRSMPVDANDLQDLNGLISDEESKIRSFHFLPFLGFDFKDPERTLIKRLGGARRVDVFSVLFAVIMMLAAMPLMELINGFIKEGLTGATPVMGVIVCLASVIYGILLFFRSIERILDLWRFEIVKGDQSLRIKKGQETYTINQDLKSSLQVLTGDGTTRLVLVRDDAQKPITLMRTDGGLRLHLTLKHLRDYLVE